MPILTIKHITTYHYRQPVAFGEHRMMLRPRDDGDQRVLASNIVISPEPSKLAWTQDVFGNHVAIAQFSDGACELRFESCIRVDHAPAIFRTADVEDYAQSYPFAYAAHDKPDLARFIAPPPSDSEVERWATCFLRDDGTADTHALLVGMTQTIRRTFRHEARHQKGTREPIQTGAEYQK